MAKTIHFKSKAGYKRWISYGHIHKVFKEKPPYEKVVIRGKSHKVKHHKQVIIGKRPKW